MVRARELFKRAEVHFSLGEFEAALELYKEAYKSKPLPGFLFNIGQCHRNLKLHDKALFFYRQYLLRLPTAGNRKEVEKLIEMCEGAEQGSAQAQPGVVRPSGSPPTASPGAVEPQSSAGYTSGTVARAVSSGSRSPPDVPRAPARQVRARWFWSGLGLSGALLVAGAVTGGLALSQSSEYKSPTTSVQKRRELGESGPPLATASSALFGLGAAAAVGTAVLYFFTDFGGRSNAVSAALGSDGGGIVVKGVF